MSETYDFVSLSETEEMAELGEGTMALVLDGGAVKRVSAGQFGGGGCCFVNFTTADGATWTADKTFEDIVSAIGSGVFPVAAVDVTALLGTTMVFYLPFSGCGSPSEDSSACMFDAASIFGMNHIAYQSSGEIEVTLEMLG